jgi:hypothetical protein
LPVDLQTAWELVVSPEGTNLWLGPDRHLVLERGGTYELDDGTAGKVRVFRHGSHLRITRQPGTWRRSSTIQVRVLARGERTTIAFHEEHLPGPAQRAKRRAHYLAALDGLERLAERRQGPEEDCHGT